METIRYFMGMDPSQGIASLYKTTNNGNIELVHSIMEKSDTIGDAISFEHKCNSVMEFFNAEALTDES